MNSITLNDFENNFDDYFQKVSDGESFLIESEFGNFMIVPYNLYKEAEKYIKNFSHNSEDNNK